MSCDQMYYPETIPNLLQTQYFNPKITPNLLRSDIFIPTRPPTYSDPKFKPTPYNRKPDKLPITPT